MSTFKIGMRVVCVSARPFTNSKHNPSLSFLEEGAKYTVEKLTGELGVVLKEVKSSHPTGGYYRPRFRPAQDQYTEEEIEAVNIDEITKEVEYA